MDEYGSLRRGNKAIQVHKLGVTHHKPPRPDGIIVDAQQLLYHGVWPCGGNVGVLAESLEARLALYAATEKFLVLHNYTEISVRIMRGSGELVLAPLHSAWTHGRRSVGDGGGRGGGGRVHPTFQGGGTA